MNARNEAFLENEVSTLTARVKELEFNCAELQKSNSELSERVKKLAGRQPSWPKGYRPQREKSHRRQFYYAGVAQLVEQLICNHQVVGSTPTAGTNLEHNDE